MKKILLILSLFPILVFSQKSYKIPADSTILNNIGSGKNELVIRNATSNITGGVLTNLGNGVTAFVLGGGSARVVDTIYKNNTKDSIVFTISGIRYAVKDSFNLNTDSQTLSISNDTLTISGGNSVILPVYVQADSSTIFSYDVLNSQNAPPGSPAIGDTYLVGNSPSGAWVGHAKDIAEWNGSAWVFTDGVQGDFLYNSTTALTYIFRSGNWVQTTGIPALNNGNTISSGLIIGTNNARSLSFETNNVNRGRFDSVGRFYVYDTSLRKSNKYLQIDSITGRLIASDISGGGGGGGASLSGLTAATATNIINNGNFQQEWQWNSLANNTGLKLSSTSGGLLNTQNRLFEVQMSGAMPTSGSSSYAGYFKNTQTVGVVYGLYAEGSTGGAIHTKGDINIDNGRLSLGSGASFYRYYGNTFIKGGSGEGMILQSNNGIASIYCGSNELGIIASRKTLNQRYVLGIGGTTYQGSYLSAFTTATLIERDLGKLIFSANTGLAGSFASFTPNNIMTINGGATEATSNVGIGTTSPVASAKLEVSSTTSGFLPPVMTSTQASAISSPAQGLMLFVTDTNGTFTSVGWWGYNGSTWEKLNN